MWVRLGLKGQTQTCRDPGDLHNEDKVLSTVAIHNHVCGRMRACTCYSKEECYWTQMWNILHLCAKANTQHDTKSNKGLLFYLHTVMWCCNIFGVLRSAAALRFTVTLNQAWRVIHIPEQHRRACFQVIQNKICLLWKKEKKEEVKGVFKGGKHISG